MQVNHQFIKAVVPHLVPVILQQLTKQEEGVEQDETAWNMAMAAGTCLGLLARTAEVRHDLRVAPWRRAGIVWLKSVCFQSMCR
jgi:importin subunit beta-1